MVCLVQGRWWIWDAHSHGECGDSFQNRQTKGEKERFPMPVLILPELKFMPCWWRQASSGGWDWNDNEKRLFYSVIQSVRSIDMCWKHEPNELTYVHMRTHVRVRFDLICFFLLFSVRDQDFTYICVCGPVWRGWCSGLNPMVCSNRVTNIIYRKSLAANTVECAHLRLEDSDVNFKW